MDMPRDVDNRIYNKVGDSIVRISKKHYLAPIIAIALTFIGFMWDWLKESVPAFMEKLEPIVCNFFIITVLTYLVLYVIEEWRKWD